LIQVPSATNQQINAVIADETRVLPEFLLASLSSPSGQRLIVDASSSTTMPILNKSKFKALAIPVPPLEEQRRIVAEVDARLSVIDAMRYSIERAQRRSAALRAAILERAFRGELVPQDPADEPAEALLARIRATRMDTQTVTRRGK
jgi:type I restriction enzyme S subunit